MSDSTQKSYFDSRLQELGITSPEMHTVNNYVYGAHRRGDSGFQSRSFQIFKEDEHGNIRIYYPSLEGLQMQYERSDSRIKKDYFITRLKEPKGDMKYKIQTGSGTRPFFSPQIIEKYQNKTEIPTLILTEGAFKAFKGCMHGIDVVGLTSITHAKDKLTAGLHEEIKDVIKACNVKKVVWLTDGDCNNLSTKAIAEMGDLYKRPKQFFSSAVAIKQYLEEFDNLEKWFVHPLSDELDDLGNPKGLDDLLIALGSERAQELADDLLSFHKRGNYKFFHKINITWAHSELFKYFHLGNVDEFFLFHSERRKDLKEKKDFVFNGTRYRWDDEKNTCTMIVHGDARNYFRVGDVYYERFPIPNKYGQDELVFHRRMKSTITDDYGRDFCKHVQKFKAFCNKPEHISYQPIINNCFNMYAPFEHEPEEGPCDTTMEFLRHIFGSNQIQFTNEDGQPETISEIDLGLDYLQLAYQKPTQTLPILCLVSRENATGKSTFVKWLKAIFTANVAIIGNSDLANDFNAGWATKLFVCCDESKIDKQVVIERIKALSTGDKIFMNAKGKDQVEIDFFAKFILLSNHEDNFIYASGDDQRWWIRKVPVIGKTKVNLLPEMIDEIPAFLDMLNKRKLKTRNVHRAWFDHQLIKTEALKKVIAASMPTIEKELRTRFREMFMDFGVTEIRMTAKKVHEEFFRGKYEYNYVLKVLRENLKVDTLKTGDGTEIVCRYQYPKWETKANGGGLETVQVMVSDRGRPFVFHRENFLSSVELNIEIEQEDPIDPPY